MDCLCEGILPGGGSTESGTGSFGECKHLNYITEPPSPVPSAVPTAVPSAVPTPRPTGYAMDDSNIRTAVAAWLSDATAAEATYGHISTWETSGVTDMSYLFCAWTNDDDASSGYCTTIASSFNDLS